MVDFQYLPMQYKNDGVYESLYDKVVLNDVITKEQYLSTDVPLYLPPISFSRLPPLDLQYKSVVTSPCFAVKICFFPSLIYSINQLLPSPDFQYKSVVTFPWFTVLISCYLPLDYSINQLLPSPDLQY